VDKVHVAAAVPVLPVLSVSKPTMVIFIAPNQIIKHTVSQTPVINPVALHHLHKDPVLPG